MNNTVDFFCLGAQKAGTTSLHHLLSMHPDVFLPEIKETHFFSDGHGEFTKGLSFYLARYFKEAAPASVKGEIDPEYMFFPEVPRRLYEAFPEAKLIFVLRDPVTRAYSHFLMSRRRGYERLDFEGAIDAELRRLEGGNIQTLSDFSYVARGYYFEQISRFLNYFPRDQMLFLFSDELKSQPEEILKEVHGFLGLRQIAYKPIGDAEANQAAEPRSWFVQNLVSGNSLGRKIGGTLLPTRLKGWVWDFVDKYNRRSIKPQPLRPEVVAKLRQCYSHDILALSDLVGRDLSHWGVTP